MVLKMLPSDEPEPAKYNEEICDQIHAWIFLFAYTDVHQLDNWLPFAPWKFLYLEFLGNYFLRKLFMMFAEGWSWLWQLFCITTFLLLFYPTYSFLDGEHATFKVRKRRPWLEVKCWGLTSEVVRLIVEGHKRTSMAILCGVARRKITYGPYAYAGSDA